MKMAEEDDIEDTEYIKMEGSLIMDEVNSPVSSVDRIMLFTQRKSVTAPCYYFYLIFFLPVDLNQLSYRNYFYFNHSSLDSSLNLSLLCIKGYI